MGENEFEKELNELFKQYDKICQERNNLIEENQKLKQEINHLKTIISDNQSYDNITSVVKSIDVYYENK